MLPPTPTQHYLVWIRFRHKIFFFASFTISKWLKKYYFWFPPPIKVLWLPIIQGWYWQIAKHIFLVSWNGIEMRCSNTVLIFFCEIKVNFRVLVQALSNKSCLYIYHGTKNLCLGIYIFRSCLMDRYLEDK